MGTRFRKSKNFGPFRINISKSGIGYSYGNKYARITHTADGKKRTTFTIPGTGISYVETEKKAPDHSQNVRKDYRETEDGQEGGNGGYLKFVLILVSILIFLFSKNAKKEEITKPLPTKSTAVTQETALPGSAAEAVQNGDLTMADIKHRAEELGWSTKAWQEWYYIANKTGVTMESIEEAAKNLNEQLAAGDAEFLAALEELGITEAEAKAMKPEELFEKVMHGIQSIEN